jgi:hypothetical protein
VWQILRGEAKLGPSILMVDYDGGHQATATAEFLVDKGHKVHMLAAALFVGQDLGNTQDLNMTRQRLLKKGITFTTDFAVMEMKGLDVIGFNVYTSEWKTINGYDSVVLAMGNRVEDSLYFKLKDMIKAGSQAAELYRIGDCVAPRKIDMAILEGDKVGRQI